MLNFEWQHEDDVTFELPNGGQLRITCGVCSEYDIAAYSARLAAAQDRLRELYELDFSAIARGEASMNGHFHEWDSFRGWAANLSALRRIEQRADDSGEWEPVELPSDWAQPATALRAIPATIMRAWSNLVNDLNPGMFGVSQSDSAKKNVRVIEKSLTTSPAPSSTPKKKPSAN